MRSACLGNRDNISSITSTPQLCPSFPTIPPSFRDDNPGDNAAGSRVPQAVTRCIQEQTQARTGREKVTMHAGECSLLYSLWTQQIKEPVSEDQKEAHPRPIQVF